MREPTIPESLKAAAKDAASITASSPYFKGNRIPQAKWDKEHIRSATTKLTVPEMERFKGICKRKGTTPYAVMRYMIWLFMIQYEWHERHNLLPPELPTEGEKPCNPKPTIRPLPNSFRQSQTPPPPSSTK